MLSEEDEAMDRRWWGFLPLVMLLGLALYLLPRTSQIRAARAAEATPSPQVLTITGRGRIQVQPDIAWVGVGVYTEADRAQDAVAENGRVVAAVMAAVQNVGIPEEDIATTRYQLFTQEERDAQGRLVRRYFVAEHQISVTVRNLDLVGQVLDAALDAGANRVYGVSFGLANPQEVLRQARVLAMQDAREQAEAVARAAEVKILGIRSISVHDSGVPQPKPYVMRAEVAAAPEGVPIASGTLDFTATVTVVFEIR